MATEINLLPKYNRRQSNIFVLSIVLGALLLVLFVFLLMQYINAKSDLEVLTATDTELLATKTEKEMALGNMQSSASDSFAVSVDFVESVSYPVTPLINELESYLIGNSYLTSYAFSESSLAVSADFETLSDVAKYVENLTKSSYFIDVQVNSVSKFNLEASEDVEEDFSVIPRHSVQFTILINSSFLGGVH